jgi:hypothetical protein
MDKNREFSDRNREFSDRNREFSDRNFDNNRNREPNAWKFHTYINPTKNQDSDPLLTAFEIFLNEVLLDKETLIEELKRDKIKRIIINTDINDVIDIPNKNIKQQFLRSKFLGNKKFKQSLIDYYNTIGVFIKGPVRFRKRDGTLTNHWIIELNLIYEKNEKKYT